VDFDSRCARGAARDCRAGRRLADRDGLIHADAAVFIPQSEAGAVLPIEASAALIATYVLAGNCWSLPDTQLDAAEYFRPVKLATAWVPPRAATTSRVVVSVGCVLLIRTPSPK
jgi:hypothetical protein